MTTNRKLYEDLLKADGINPTDVSDSERVAFRNMLDQETKRSKRLSWGSVGLVWAFFVLSLGLVLSERVSTAWRTVLAAVCFVSLAGLCILLVVWLPRHNRTLREVNRKVSRLQYLVYGKRRGWVLIGRRQGKRVILWPRILLFTAVFWLVMSLIGAGVYYLLCGAWAYSINPMLHILICTGVSIVFVLMILYEGLKTPIEELVEIGEKHGSSLGKWLLSNHGILKLGAASAVILLAVIIGLDMLEGEPTWAMVMQAFDRVEEVHVTQKMVWPDGKELQGEAWIKKPDCIREEYDNGAIIDNGRERLTLDKEKKTAKFSESFAPYQPIEEHHMFTTIALFRNEGQFAGKYEIEIVKIDKESDKTTLVFCIREKDAKTTAQVYGKAWVDRKTMLIRRYKAEFIQNANAPIKVNNPQSAEVEFDYTPIVDTMFDTAVPEGYTVLPRQQPRAVSGKVIDEDGKPVAGATVYMVSKFQGLSSNETKTDAAGGFAFNLPPEGAGQVWLPSFLRAFKSGDRDHVAWTIIEDPGRKKAQSMPLPGETGTIDYDPSTGLKGASGIVLQMEPAGWIYGQVTDVVGVGIGGANISLFVSPSDKSGYFDDRWDGYIGGPNENGKLQAVTDDEGRYECLNVPRFWKKTQFTVTAKAEGYLGSVTSFESKGTFDSKEVNLELLLPALTVEGVLLDNYGTPLVAAPIYCRVQGVRGPCAKTDQNGRFKLEGCPEVVDLKIEASLAHGFSINAAHAEEFYPDAVATIDYREGQTHYEVKLITQRPELKLHVTVKNTKGEILPYFPVEIRADRGYISTEWKVQKHFIQRTDAKGCCTFTEVPDMDGLKLVLRGQNDVPFDTIGDEVRKIIAEYEKIYFWAEIPVEIIEGQKEYTITGVALTHEEWKKQQNTYR
ncbi:MAG: carboxypeptidase regulatory-like domain-containing protein [Sedimentisphaerales bacterium]|nr:carboxypeptidase regulatory-like domain-containing protein [Sedimentisphaerales bacterium]